MISDIKKHISLVEEAINWAKKYKKEAFPFDTFRNYRRELRKISNALSENCSAAAYGESQVGKSYLMSSLLSSPDQPFVITNGDKEFSFIDELNQSGGNNAQIESTGVVTRFTLDETGSKPGFVKVRCFSIVDIILLIADSYYNDVKIDVNLSLKYDEISQRLSSLASQYTGANEIQDLITEDDIKDIVEYIDNVIGNNAKAIHDSNFCQYVAPIISKVPCERWCDFFCLLWNRNPELTRLFSTLINEYKKFGFCNEIYVPFDAVLKENGTILKIEWLDQVCGVHVDTGKDNPYTDIYNEQGNLLANNFSKAYLSALIAEVVFVVPKALADKRKFLLKMDLLDFPGARSREKIKEAEVKTVLPKMLRRGKVAYLFNKYSRSLRISSVLFCHHNNQKSEPTIGETIDSWINEFIGETAEQRASMLTKTNGISPLFLVATKFNIDLQRNKSDKPDTVEKLDEHWDRFNKVIPEIVKPSRWMEDWVTPGGVFTSPYFQNIYPLRDFYWSGKNQVFEGYSDGDIKTPETKVHEFDDYPNYFENLKNSFLNNQFVRDHFANPEQTWADVATVNNDGSRAIIKNLDNISTVLDEARKTKYYSRLKEIKADIENTLRVYYQPEDKTSKNERVKKISGDIRRSLFLKVGSNPQIFGTIIDCLMVTSTAIRDIAYEIIICHSDSPRDFTQINFIRANAGINLKDDRDTNLRKLYDFFRGNENQISADLKREGLTIEDFIDNESEAVTTVADVVTKHIVDYWIEFENSQAKNLQKILPHADEVIFMLISLFKKLNIKKLISEKINYYCQVFEEENSLNAIADFASLTLNNFVTNVGLNYFDNEEIEEIEQRAKDCNININRTSIESIGDKQNQKLEDVLEAFDRSVELVNQDNVDLSMLRNLPLWDNFQRWENLVTFGLLYASDIEHFDPESNSIIKSLLDSSSPLYK